MLRASLKRTGHASGGADADNLWSGSTGNSSSALSRERTARADAPSRAAQALSEGRAKLCDRFRRSGLGCAAAEGARASPRAHEPGPVRRATQVYERCASAPPTGVRCAQRASQQRTGRASGDSAACKHRRDDEAALPSSLESGETDDTHAVKPRSGSRGASVCFQSRLGLCTAARRAAARARRDRGAMCPDTRRCRGRREGATKQELYAAVERRAATNSTLAVVLHLKTAPTSPQRLGGAAAPRRPKDTPPH